MRLNLVRLGELVAPRKRQKFPEALQPPPPPPANIPIPPARLRRLWHLEEEPTGLRGAKLFPAALYPSPSPPGNIPIPPPRLKRVWHLGEDVIGKKGAKPFPTGLYNRVPPQFLTGTTSLAITVTFGSGSVGQQLTGQQSLIINVEFGAGALLLRPFTLFIDGVDQTDLLVVNTLQVHMQISQVSTAQFGLWDPTGNPANLPQVGQQVTIYRNLVRVFGGYIEKPGQGQFMALSGSMFLGGTAFGSGGSVTASDYSSLLDRRYVGRYYGAPTSLSTIVADIVENYLAADGFTYDTIDGDPGIDLGNQLFDWVTVRQAFNTLSSLTGWDFTVDFFQTIRFYPAGDRLGIAPFNIADSDGNTLAESMVKTFDRSTYRNKQGVRNSSGSGSLWSDIFSAAHPGPFPNAPQPPGNGRIVFFTSFPINQTPVVTVNGVTQKVASILDIAAHLPSTVGWQWAWDPPQGDVPTGGDFVEQNTANPPLGISDVLVVNYQTQLSPIIWVQDDTQIAERAAIEGNTGVYEDVQNVPTTMTDPAAQLLYAEALLARYGSPGIPYEIQYMTIKDGLFPGFSQTVHQTTPPVSLTLGLITQVDMQDVDKTYFQYTVVVASGEYLGRGAAQFFASLIAESQQPQPSNRNVYQWQIAPSYPGIVNPGVTGGFVSTQVETPKNSVEQILSMTIWLENPLGSAAHFALLQNTNGILGIDLDTGDSGLKVVYAASGIQLHLQDILRIEIDEASSPIKDAVVTVVTAVLVN